MKTRRTNYLLRGHSDSIECKAFDIKSAVTQAYMSTQPRPKIFTFYIYDSVFSGLDVWNCDTPGLNWGDDCDNYKWDR